MEALGGVVSRTWREYFEEEMNAREVASLKAEIEQLKAEEAQAQAQQKAKLHAKIDALNSKLETKLEQAKQRSEQIKNQTEAKIKALQQKVAKDDREAIAAMQARIAEIRDRSERSAAHLSSAIAGQLRKTAERLEKVG
jgi:DNA anti-recombination protein RmuC